MKDPEIGERWEHFKGTIYRIVGFSTCVRTEEKLVVYRAVDSIGLSAQH